MGAILRISSSQLGNRLRISGISGNTNIASSGKLKCTRVNTSGRERICCRNIWTPQKSTFDFPRRYSNRPSSIILELGIRNRPQMAVAIRATSNNSVLILFAILIVLPQERLRGAAIKKDQVSFQNTHYEIINYLGNYFCGHRFWIDPHA